MRHIFLLILIFAALQTVHAQSAVEVPSTIYFADLKLHLTPEARKKIQTDTDALTRHARYFNAKVKKVDAHLPLIEQVLREEGVPDDIKYLVIQESALVGDAVSSSNAVGYWQFKEATGREVGLTINREVDERMNIVTATRGAARYFKNNNTFFDNWLYALLAYYAGPGGALKIADKKYYGKKEMRLDGRTHWYVIKYLAHKMAFENAVNRNPDPDMVLFSYMGGRGKTLAEVAREFELEESQLEPYNKWIRRNRIPGDKDYPLIIPDYSGRRPEPLLARTGYPQPPRRVIEQTSREATRTDTNFATVENTDAFPRIEQARRWGRAVTLVNRVRATLLRGGEDIKDISERTGVAPSRLVKFNDLTSEDAQLREGDPFYLRNKRNKAPAHYHAVLPGETLWSISQRFGIKLDKLLRNNRMRQEEKLRPGRVLWLRFIRPPHIPVEYRSVPGQKERPPAGPAEKAVSSRQKSVKQEQEQPGRTVKPVASARPGTVSAASEQARRPAAEKEPDPVNESTARPKAKKERGTEKPLIPVVDEKNTIRERYHVVKAGETLYSIARRYDLTVPQLTSYNDLSYEADLAIGQRLRLSPPENSTPPATAGDSGNSPEISFTEHEVQPGETMYRIARQYEVSIKELMEWNEKEDFNVSVGEKLKVKRP